MDYRTFSTTGQRASLLGFGAMRLPVMEEVGKTKIDEAEAIRMIRHAIDHGVTYVDTAYPYHGGESEVVVGKALADGYREKVMLADKLPVWLVQSKEDLPKLLTTQLERLGTDRIDYYLLHSLGKESWQKVKDLEILRFLEEQRAEGKIGAIGFSFHDDYALFEEILNSYSWDFCQIQFNYLDVEFQAGLRGLKLAGEKKIPVVVMEPIKGGGLGNMMPDQVRGILDGSGIKRGPAEWALRWVANFPQVVCILSGMSTMDQVQENLVSLSDAQPESLSALELDTVEQAAATFKAMIPAPCTHCQYCLPCPAGIEIPTILLLYNDYHIQSNKQSSKNRFKMWIDTEHGPISCTECGLCEAQCPQHLPVPELMKKAAGIFQPQ